MVEVLGRYSNRHGLLLHKVRKTISMSDRHSQSTGDAPTTQPAAAPGLPSWQRTPLHPQTRLSEDAVAELVDAYQAGATIAELGDRFHVNPTTVVRHLERHGVARRQPQRSLSDAQIEEASRLYQDGWQTAQLGRRFGVATETMRLALRSAGVPARYRHRTQGYKQP